MGSVTLTGPMEALEVTKPMQRCDSTAKLVAVGRNDVLAVRAAAPGSG
jgi:hypothetical protein